MGGGSRPRPKECPCDGPIAYDNRSHTHNTLQPAMRIARTSEGSPMAPVAGRLAAAMCRPMVPATGRSAGPMIGWIRQGLTGPS
jgi:hypothetical protein